MNSVFCLSSGLVSGLAEGLTDLVGLVLGETCAGCGRAGGALCAACAGVLARRPQRCRGRPGCPPVWSAGPYAGCHRSALLAFKERHRRGLADPLGRALAAAAEAAAPGRDGRALALVPVPARPGALRRRGFDPMRLLSAAAARTLTDRGRPARSVPALAHARRVADQVGLDRRGRRANLAGALTAPPSAGPLLRGRTVVLVDDVLTTGATLGEAARALRAAGTPAAAAAVLVERSVRGNLSGSPVRT